MKRNALGRRQMSVAFVDANLPNSEGELSVNISFVVRAFTMEQDAHRQ